MFPDAAPLHLSRIQLSLERAGLHTRHVEDFPDDYARTLLEWQRRFESNIDRARELGGDERVRVWRIYLRVSRQGFESGFMSVYQVRAVKPALDSPASSRLYISIRNSTISGSGIGRPAALRRRISAHSRT